MLALLNFFYVNRFGYASFYSTVLTVYLPRKYWLLGLGLGVGSGLVLVITQ